jgi:hypothetical protein
MKKMYRATFGWSKKVEEFEVSKESDSSVWLMTERGNECRELKITQNHCWYDNKEDAYSRVKTSFEEKINSLERQLKMVKNDYSDFCTSNGI